jgi:hypothetical protein
MTTELPPQPTEPPAPTPSVMPLMAPARPRGRLATLATGFALGAALVGGSWAITANKGPDDPGTFTLTGTFELGANVYNDPDDDSCRGGDDSGYDDIAEGTSVTVYGAGDDVIATGRLGDSESDEYGATCTYAISIPDVPKGEKFYKVEVSHRGTLQLSAEEAEGGELTASLG